MTTGIYHRIGIEGASTDDVYAKLTTIEGLSGWWTTQTQGEAGLGGKIEFRFDGGGMDGEVIELVPGQLVRWRVVDGPAEWMDTIISFELSEADGYAIVLFSHDGWAEPVPFMHHCTTKWGTFLLSLKALIETGRGTSFPDDVRIGNWR